MHKLFKIGAVALAASVGAFTATKIWMPVPALAEGEAFNDGQVKSIEKIVRDYLIAHPEVLLEAQEAYEKKNEAKRTEAQMTRMPEFYKALDGMKGDLAAFTVGSGDVTMVEFFDYNCGFCQKTLPEIMKLLDDDKHFKLLFLEFPILSAGSQDASKVAVAAARQGKYFEYHKLMLSTGHASKDTALKVAEKIGLDMNKVKTDMASPETEALIAKLSELGRKIYVDGTPSFIVGDKTYPGAGTLDQLKQLIDDTRKDGCKACVTDAAPATGAGAKDPKKS